SEGWDVWWDRTIPPGRQFDEVIEEALDAATCVVVLWSKASIASTWVKTEAAEANRRKLLIPVVIEDVKIPLEFRRLQAADLTGWMGERAHPEVDKFIAAIEREIGRPGGPPAKVPTIRPAESAAASSFASSPATLPMAAQAQPERAPTLPRSVVAERVPGDSAPRQAALKWAIAGVLLMLLVGGFAWYQSEQRSQRQALQAEQQRQELERKLEEGQRLAAEERERLAKDAADQAERERAARELLAKEKAAREAAEREAARRQAADAAAAQTRLKLAEEASARRPTDFSPPRSAAPAPQAAAPQSSSSLASVSSGLTWRDHALIYSGTLVLDNAGATLRAAITDLKNGRRIGGYSVPARISLRSPERGEYFVQAEFDIPGDSTTPSPHTHQVGLIVRRQSDGTLRMVQNCPQPGNCF
ncbi:MAG: TIR domain-containing protein, partial [Burkholderiaceae bacterium]